MSGRCGQRRPGQIACVTCQDFPGSPSLSVLAQRVEPGNEAKIVLHVAEPHCSHLGFEILKLVEDLQAPHLANSVLLWFEKVRGGSRCLNHPEHLQKHPALLVSPVTRYIEKVRYSRTTPTSSVRGGSTVPILL